MESAAENKMIFLNFLKSIGVIGLMLNSFTYGKGPIEKPTGIDNLSQFELLETHITMPMGYFAFVRDGKKLGAVKFLQAKSISKNHAKAKYAWVLFRVGGKGKLEFRESGIDEATFRFSPIIGRFALQSGNAAICIEFICLNWYGGTALEFEKTGGDGQKVDIAPTDIMEIGKDFSIEPKKLFWYQYEENRKTQKIALQKIAIFSNK